MPFYKDYFNVPYPLPKLDLIAIADFAAGLFVAIIANTFIVYLIKYCGFILLWAYIVYFHFQSYYSVIGCVLSVVCYQLVAYFRGNGELGTCYLQVGKGLGTCWLHVHVQVIVKGWGLVTGREEVCSHPLTKLDTIVHCRERVLLVDKNTPLTTKQYVALVVGMFSEATRDSLPMLC